MSDTTTGPAPAPQHDPATGYRASGGPDAPSDGVGTWTLTWNGVRTVAQLELRQRVRSTRWKVSLVVFALLVGGVSALTWAFAHQMDPSGLAAGPSMFGFIVFFVLFLGLLVSPTLAATTINGDRAAGTLATLQVTLLSAAEIAVGKLLAAWLASLAFLGVSVPFILWAFATGGTSPLAVVVTLALLALLLAVVCAVGLGFSALTARPAGSAVLSYVSVAALSILSVILFGLSITLVSGEERVTVFGVDWESEPPVAELEPGMADEEYVSPPCETYTTTRWVAHTERTWWLLAINPFVIVADAAPSAPGSPETMGSFDPLTGIREGVRAARQGPPEVFRECWEGPMAEDVPPPTAETMSPVWPWGLAAHLLLGAAGVVLAVHRLRIPQRTLAKGTRVA